MALSIRAGIQGWQRGIDERLVATKSRRWQDAAEMTEGSAALLFGKYLWGVATMNGHTPDDRNKS